MSPTRPISELCRDPERTRAKAELGEPVPCSWCLAWDGVECFFIKTGQRPAAKDDTPPPTPDTLWGPPEQED